MTAGLPDRALQLRSLVTSQGMLELSLHDVPVPTPATNEVLVRVEASAINPSDLGSLVATWATTDGSENFDGYDRTIGPSGGCGKNLWLTIEMPFTLTKTG
jgi:hypothetical protein